MNPVKPFLIVSRCLGIEAAATIARLSATIYHLLSPILPK